MAGGGAAQAWLVPQGGGFRLLQRYSYGAAWFGLGGAGLVRVGLSFDRRCLRGSR